MKLNKVSKIYSSGKKAVEGLDLSMYNGQIFSLLGPNGAGKTSTISMISGLIDITVGNIQCFGKDTSTNMDEIRYFLNNKYIIS